MLRGYDLMYLEDVADNIGSMYDYAVYDHNLNIVEFHNLFIKSGVARLIELGDIRFITGLSGCELCIEVLNRYYKNSLDHPDPKHIDFEASPEYWTGWILAQYQYFSGRTFSDINRTSSIDRILSMYNPYHEADKLKTFELLDDIAFTS